MEEQTQAQPPIRISVRNLVEFVMRNGDLDNRRTARGKERGHAGRKQASPQDTEAYGKRYRFRR